METLQRLARRATGLSGYVLGAIVLMVLAAAVSWSGMLLVFAEQAIPGWQAGAGLFSAGLGLLWMRSKRIRRAPDTAATSLSARTRRLLILFVAATGLVGGLGAAGDLVEGAEYFVLEPSGPDGCRAVVRESTFLVIGNGEVYTTGAMGIVWHPVSSWRTDDGIRPIASGSYEMKWSREGGVLVVKDDGINPVMPALHTVDCG
ncbi:hypothetical protein H9Y04_35320 [Streptomyces sp. TRM66268-LWL]|uniref:Lipoprotein n=1 Tax=Streptomyces polyasparticus TaxID=2767826 RepID=A0ABR7SQP3_9ACTN|nr:hypothetical protein [Streptomyces polyasparticus]MBC9717815.1 hypothetical protein [Streptomyces polyasparticus]